jgi:hypothetical protein
MMTGAFSSSICAPDCFLASCLRTTKDFLPEFYPTDTSKMVGYILTASCIVASAVAYDAYYYYYWVVASPTKTTNSNNNKDKSCFDKNLKIQYQKVPAAICSAVLFSVGLAISGMIENRHIVGFLDMKGFARGTWDPILLFVMGGGLLVSLISYEFVPGYSLMMVSVHKIIVVVFVCVCVCVPIKLSRYDA